MHALTPCFSCAAVTWVGRAVGVQTARLVPPEAALCSEAAAANKAKATLALGDWDFNQLEKESRARGALRTAGSSAQPRCVVLGGSGAAAETWGWSSGSGRGGTRWLPSLSYWLRRML